MMFFHRLTDLLREPADDLLSDPKTAFATLKPEQYKAEQELADRYRSFVAEILRISLAGIAVFGFLYKAPLDSAQPISGAIAAVGVLMFAASAVCALIFLFFAAESLRYYVIALRHYAKNPSPSDRDMASATCNLEERLKRISVCRRSKAWASFALASGGVLMAFAILLMLWCGK